MNRHMKEHTRDSERERAVWCVYNLSLLLTAWKHDASFLHRFFSFYVVFYLCTDISPSPYISTIGTIKNQFTMLFILRILILFISVHVNVNMFTMRCYYKSYFDLFSFSSCYVYRCTKILIVMYGDKIGKLW